MSDPLPPDSPAGRLLSEPYRFDFFQAVRLLRELAGDAAGPVPADATVRFAAYPSLAFPPSTIADLRPPGPDRPPVLALAFLGLTGPSGVLPRHYTELLLRAEREAKGAERGALRDWFDLFNHRMAVLFYAAWEKYRFTLPFARGAADRPDLDPFTRALFSLAGLGTGGLRNRLTAPPAGGPTDGTHAVAEPAVPRAGPKVDDVGLLRFAGILAQRHRGAWGLEVLAGDYFGVPVAVEQFRGQGLLLDPPNQTRLGAEDGNCTLEADAVAGDRVWDMQGKFRVRVGPLRYAQFLDLMPDPAGGRTTFALLARLVRFYAGDEFDFDVQLVLINEHAPACVLDDHDAGPRIGWNCWLLSDPLGREADDAVFEGDAT